MTSAAIDIRQLVTHYGSRLILDHVDLMVEAGEIMVIMGEQWLGQEHAAASFARSECAE